MNRKGRIWFFVVSLLIFALAFTAVTGFTTQYGDTTTTVVRPLKNFNTGKDINGRVEVTLAPANGAEATEDQLASLQSYLTKRLSAQGVGSASVSVDEKQKLVYLSFPYNKDVNPQELVKSLLPENMLTIRKGAERDVYGKPAGETANGIIVNGYDLTAAEVRKGLLTDSEQEEYYLALTLSEMGLQMYQAALAAQAEQTGSVISFWLGDEMISSADSMMLSLILSYQQEVVLTGDFNEETVKQLAEKLNGGPIPYALQVQDYSVKISTPAPSQNVFWVALIAFAVLAALLIFVFRLPGLAAAISLLGQAGMTLVLITGYFSVFTAHALTKSGITAFFLVLGLGTLLSALIATNMREELRAGKKLSVAMKTAFSWRSVAPMVEANIVLIIVALVILGTFAPSGTFYASLMSPFYFAFAKVSVSPLYSFGHIFFWGILFNLIFSLVIFRLLVVALSKMKMFSSVRCYGGLPEGVEGKAPPKNKIMQRAKVMWVLPVLLLVCTVVLGFFPGAMVDASSRPGLTAVYSYEGELDTTLLKEEPAFKGVFNIPGEEHHEGVKVFTRPSDVLFNQQYLHVQASDMPNASSASAGALLSALQQIYPENKIQQVEVKTQNLTTALLYTLRLVVGCLAALAIMWIYFTLRMRRFHIKKGVLPLMVMQLFGLIAAVGASFAFSIPLGSNLFVVFLVTAAFAVYGLVTIFERVQDNQTLYGKKMSLQEMGNLSLTQSRGRLIISYILTVIPLVALSVYALFWGLRGVLATAIPLLVVLCVQLPLLILVVAPWWIKRQTNGSK